MKKLLAIMGASLILMTSSISIGILNHNTNVSLQTNNETRLGLGALNSGDPIANNPRNFSQKGINWSYGFPAGKIAIGKDGSIYVGTEQNGVYKSTNGGSSFTQLNSANNGLPEYNNVSELFVDSYNQVWVVEKGSKAGDSDIIYCSDDNGSSFYRVLLTGSTSESFSIKDFKQGPDGQYWVVTDGSGIYTSINWGKNWALLDSKNNGIPTNDGWFNVDFDSNKNTYLASGNAIYREEIGKNSFAEYLLADTTIPSKFFHMTIANDKMYITQHTTNYYDYVATITPSKSPALQKVLLDGQSAPGAYLSYSYKDIYGDYWIGCSNAGLYFSNIGAGNKSGIEFHSVTVEDNGFKQMLINDMIIDQQNRIWATTGSGLWYSNVYPDLDLSAYKNDPNKAILISLIVISAALGIVVLYIGYNRLSPQISKVYASKIQARSELKASKKSVKSEPKNFDKLLED